MVVNKMLTRVTLEFEGQGKFIETRTYVESPLCPDSLAHSFYLNFLLDTSLVLCLDL